MSITDILAARIRAIALAAEDPKTCGWVDCGLMFGGWAEQSAFGFWVRNCAEFTACGRELRPPKDRGLCDSSVGWLIECLWRAGFYIDLEPIGTPRGSAVVECKHNDGGPVGCASSSDLLTAVVEAAEQALGIAP